MIQDGNLYKAYLYSSSKEKVSYKTKNKKKYRVYTGNYKIALFDKTNRKKQSTINTNIKTYSPTEMVNTGTVKVIPHKKNQPSLIGIEEKLTPPDKKIVEFDTLYYVHNGKLAKVKVKVEQENIKFFNHDKLLNTKANQYTGLLSQQEEGTLEIKWIFKPKTGEMDVTSCRLIKNNRTIQNYPIFAYVKEIKFQDKYLEEAVRKNLKKPTGPIRLQDLDQLKSLEAEYSGITDLSGLEYARNLEKVNLNHNGLNEDDFWVFGMDSKIKYLDVSANEIKDINFLYSLDRLNYLDIGSTAIKDIEPLRSLTNLKELYFYGTAVKDLTPIAHLNNLVDLDISGTDVTNFSPLKDLTKLETLWMRGANVNSFAFLNKLSNLKTLNIDDTFYGSDDRIDGSPLKNLNRLENLYMNRVQFKDFTFLQSVKNLKKLVAPISNVSTMDVAKNFALEYLEIQSADLSGLSDLTNLKHLDISDSEASNLEPLSKLVNLTELYASSNNIEDITPIARLPKLVRLILDDNNIESLPVLQLPNLISMSLSNNLLTDIQPLASLTSLKELYIEGNDITDFTPLEKLSLEELIKFEEGDRSTSLIKDEELEYAVRKAINKPTGNLTEADLEKLKELTIVQDDINSLEGLQYATNLTSLSLVSTPLSDVSPIRNLTQLVSLDLSYNKIKDLEPLSQLVNLEELNLGQNRIEQIDALANLTKLKNLTLSNNNISKIDSLANLKKLETLSLDQNQIVDVDALGQLLMLKRLELASNQIEDIPFEHLENMEYLYLDGNPLESIESLSNMPNLKVIYFNETKVEDISVLEGLTTLEIASFNMSSEPFEDDTVNQLLHQGVTLYINGMQYIIRWE